jgi:hypothetical protein
MAAEALKPMVAHPFLPCRRRGAAWSPQEGRGGGARPILRREGAESFTEMAGHGGALAEERGDGAGPHQWVRCLGLGVTSCAAPRGCRRTRSTWRGSSSCAAKSRDRDGRWRAYRWKNSDEWRSVWTLGKGNLV